ncbi:fdxN element excision recombinase XisF [Nostoc sp. FACHB-110]|uniref:fdxN element excision recombinase XisF n=1 Tax=Nostoc sp. FACHB-110 TaxID=2692834 RepID=UPI0016883719|nr:fdxN element excision recombinase XisF [Nostoc sp. FACHB-110]MBD2438773.1 recombinase family protein [Nostoc sp. FACHB-110]
MESWGYARVSGEEQQTDKGALRKQIERLRGVGCSKVYWDIQSRTTEVREGLQQLINDLKTSPKGKVKSLQFTRIDRIGSSSRLFYSLLEVLRSKGIKLIALDQGVDPDSLGGELTIDMLLAAAKFEVRMVTERLKSERRHRVNQGKSHRVAPLGYRIDKDKYICDRSPCVCLLEGRRELTVSDVARYIFNTFFECGSVAATVRKLHADFGIETKAFDLNKPETSSRIVSDDDLDKIVFTPHKTNHPLRYPWSGLRWSIAGLKALLVNPVYAGGLPYDTYVKSKGKRKNFDEWKVKWGTHDDQAIITYEEHERVKQIIRENRNNRWASREDKEVNPFANLIKCAHCGGSMTRHAKRVNKDGEAIYYYQCRLYKAGNCSNKNMISSKVLDIQVVDFLAQEAERLANLVETDEPLPIEEPAEVKTLRASLNTLETLPPSLAIEQIKNDLKEQIAIALGTTHNTAKESLIAKERIIQAFANKSYWQGLKGQDKRLILNGCVKKIFVDGHFVTAIEYRY